MKPEKESKVVYRVSKKLEQILSLGGRVLVLDDNRLILQCDRGLKLYHFEKREVLSSLESEDDPILAFCICKGTVVVTAHKSGLLKLWEVSKDSFENLKIVNAQHKNPILFVISSEDELITISTDFIVKLWDMKNQVCSGLLRGLTAFPTVAVFHKDLFFIGTKEGKIFIWKFREDKSKPYRVLEKHFSSVTDIVIFESENRIVSSSRDKVLVAWSLRDLECFKILPTFVPTTALTKLYDGRKFSLLRGDEEGGVWKVFPTNLKGDAVSFSFVAVKELRGINQILTTQSFIYVIQDGIITQSPISSLGLDSESISTNVYEVLDLIIVADQYLISAHNSPSLNCYDLKKPKSHRMATGHDDAVIALSSNTNSLKFVSGSKDKVVVLWEILPDEFHIVKIAVCKGHSSSISGVVLGPSFSIFSVSKDCVMKFWPIDDDPYKYPLRPKALRTVLAHEKGEVNSLDLSLDGQLLASGSQDKTAKIWSTTTFALQAHLTGHRRGIWCVKFSEFDRILATASTDANVKLWELGSYSCLRTLEGHEASVLKCLFVGRHRVASVSSDGMLKIWNVETGNILGSFDAHDDQIWALAVYEDSTIFTGGADGQTLQWIDETEAVLLEELEAKNKAIYKEQSLENLFRSGNMAKAFKFAISADKPRRTLAALQNLYKEDKIEEALDLLSKEEMKVFTGYLSTWNCFGQHSVVTQSALNALIKKDTSFIQQNKVDEKDMVALISYSKKHLERVRKLRKRISVVDLLISNMSL